MDALGTYVSGRSIVRGAPASMAQTRFRSCPVAEFTAPGLVQIVDAHRREMADTITPSAAMWEAVDVVSGVRAECVAKAMEQD